MNIHNHNTRNKLDFHVIPYSLSVWELSIQIYGVRFGITYLHFKKPSITLIHFDLSLKVTYSYNRHCTLYIYFHFRFCDASIDSISVLLCFCFKFFSLILYMAFDKSCMSLTIVNY